MADHKTLDDIRRELAAEYPPFPTTRAPIDGDGPDAAAADGSAAMEVQPTAPAVAVQPAAPRRTRARHGYIIAGVIGCLAGQFVVLGFSTVARHRVAPSVASVGAPMAAPASQPVAASPAQLAQSPVVQPGTDALAPVAQPGAGALPAVAPTRADPVATEPPAPPSVSPPVNPHPVAKDPGPRRPAKPRPAAPAPGAVASPGGAGSVPRSRSEIRPSSEPGPSDEWARSQEEVRAALNEWLSRSGHAAARAHTSETVVFLGADGRTARTHVPIRSANGVVVREQRWTREASGWRLVEEHDAWQAK